MYKYQRVLVAGYCSEELPAGTVAAVRLPVVAPSKFASRPACHSFITSFVEQIHNLSKYAKRAYFGVLSKCSREVAGWVWLSWKAVVSKVATQKSISTNSCTNRSSNMLFLSSSSLLSSSLSLPLASSLPLSLSLSFSSTLLLSSSSLLSLMLSF